jgi:hypothetical protein
MSRDFWWLFGRPAWFAASAYRQQLPKFALTSFVKATGKCTTGSQNTNVVPAWLCSGTFSLAVRDVLNDTYRDRCIGGGGTPAWPACSPDFNPLDFYICGDTKKPLCVQLLLTIKRDFAIALWMPVISATTPATSNGCGGPWDMSRSALNLVENILSPYYKCTLSARSRDSVVGIATGYGLDDRGVGVRVPVGSPRRSDRLWSPPNLLSNGYRVEGGCFPGGKSAGAWSWPLTSS